MVSKIVSPMVSKMNREVIKRFNETPSNKTFAFTLESFGAGKAVVSMPSDGKWTQEEGVIHGGVLMTIADCASAQAILHDLPEDTRCATCDMSIKNLRPAWPNKEPLRAEAEVVKSGARLVFSEVRVYQGDELVGLCSFTHVLFKKR